MPSSFAGPVIKICGLCRPEDAAAASAAGATHVGVVLAGGYARTRSRSDAAAILAAGEGLRRVGVFVDEPFEEAVALSEALELDVLQLHGDESTDYVMRMRSVTGREVWRSLRPRTESDLRLGLERYGRIVDALLIDGWHARAAGGTGTRVPVPLAVAIRDAVPEGVGLVLAGGLSPGNVAELVALVRPDAVDVSSGVESEPGRKDAAAMSAFVRAARSALERVAGRERER